MNERDRGTYITSPTGEQVLIAQDLGIEKRPDLAKKLRKFQEDMDFVETHWRGRYRKYPGEMIIVLDGQVVAHGEVDGTGGEKLWEQVDAAGLERGRAHWAILSAPTTTARDLQGYDFGQPSKVG